MALYVDAPRMAPYLMDALAGKVRRRGASAMVAAYAPSLPLDFVKLQLGLETAEEVRRSDSMELVQPLVICDGCMCLWRVSLASALLKSLCWRLLSNLGAVKLQAAEVLEGFGAVVDRQAGLLDARASLGVEGVAATTA